MAEVKTNAMRILDKNKISFQMHSYEAKDGQIDGLAVAKKLHQDPERVFKTIVTRSPKGEIFVFVIPVNRELNLKKCAKSVGAKAIELIKINEINKITGYIRGGCSPIGMKKQYPTVIDRSAQEKDTIIFSGGRIGTQIELEPAVLADIIGAQFADIT